MRSTTRAPSALSPGAGVAPHGQRPGVPLPRQAGCAEGVVAEVHQHDHANATLVPGIDAVDVVTQCVGTLDAEQYGRRIPSPRLRQTVDRADDDSAGLSGLPLDLDELRLDRIPRAPAEIPAGDDRVAHRLGDDSVHGTLPQRVEPDLGRRTHRDCAPHRTERLRNESPAVGVQIEHERLPMESFPVECFMSTLSARVRRLPVRAPRQAQGASRLGPFDKLGPPSRSRRIGSCLEHDFAFADGGQREVFTVRLLGALGLT